MTIAQVMLTKSSRALVELNIFSSFFFKKKVIVFQILISLLICKCGSIDTQSYLIWCGQYKHLREERVLESDQDILEYLKEVWTLEKRRNKDLV